MPEKRVVVVTGTAGYWGGRVATRLLSQPGFHVIGLDDDPPEPEIKGLDFVQAGIGNPLLAELFKEEQVDTVCHLKFEESARPSESAFEANVMGAMKLLGACAEAGVRKIVVKSCMMVYGAQPTNAAFLREDHPLDGNHRYGYLRDLVEIESFCSGFPRQTPATLLTVLRFAHIVGPKADTPLTRFLREEEAFVLLGFDPMMQVIHEDDVVGALAHAVNNDAPGVFNVAAEGVLPLWRVMGLAGKIPAPVLHPLAYLSVSFLGPRYAPIDLDYLRYRCVGDLDRMRRELQFKTQYSAEEALREYASHQRLRRFLPEALAQKREEERLRDTIERRRRARQQASEYEARARRRGLKRRGPAPPAPAKVATGRG